jgi:hypothetical protein
VAEQRDPKTSESFFGNTFDLLKQTFQEWLEDKAPQLGAALAYYTVFSLAPLVLVLLSIVGVLFREDPAGAWDKITQQMSYFLDPSAIQVVQNIAQKASQPGKSMIATIIGVSAKEKPTEEELRYTLPLTSRSDGSARETNRTPDAWQIVEALRYLR